VPVIRRRTLLTAWSVPTPFPGELGYSVIARYLRSWGGLDPEGLITQVVGHRPASVHPVCVPGIRRVADICLSGERDPTSAFISRHTLLPYYSAFERRGEFVRWKEVLKSDDRACITKLVRPTSMRIGAPTGLRLCPTCLDMDRLSGREPYWRRLHQLPGIFHCSKDGDRLRRSSVAFAVDRSLSFLTPNSVHRSSLYSPVEPPFFNAQLEKFIASRSKRLLSGQLTTEIPCSPQLYRRYLIQFGFGGRKKEVRTTAFEDDFGKWLRSYACQSEQVGAGRWWLRLMTAIPGRSTPLQHLIFRQYLREKMESYVRGNGDFFGFERFRLN
jgi:TniQ